MWRSKATFNETIAFLGRAQFLDLRLAPHLLEESSSRSWSPHLKLEAAHHIFVNTIATDAYFSMPTIGRLSPSFERRCRCATRIGRNLPAVTSRGRFRTLGRTK